MTTSFGLLLVLIAQAPTAPPVQTFERAIVVSAPGPQKLAVDAALLVGGAPFTVVPRSPEQERAVAENGLSDLRLIGADGREVPYLLVYRTAPDPQWRRAGVQAIAATDKTSGFEADLGSVQEIDAVDLRRLPGPFMKRFALEASADREHWTQVVAEGTLFDLPERRLRQTAAVFAAGAYRYLRVTWDDTHSARVPLPADVMIRLSVAGVALPPPPVTAAPLAFVRRASEPGRSRYHITLPARRLPIVALRLEIGGTYLFRSAMVTEPRLAAWQAAPVEIGGGLLVRDQASGTTLPVFVQQPSQAELDLLVEDNDNPPLDLRSVTAVFAELPWIYVEAPGPLVARYGDVTLPRPSYDLEAARGTVQIDALPEARWGTPFARTPPAPAPAIDAAALGGGPLDMSSFRYSRALTSAASPLLALPLDAAVLAHSAGPSREFADVRIVDGSGRQVPRLVERRPEPLLIPLRAVPAAPAAAELQPRPNLHRSIYHIDLPYAALPEANIVVATTSPVFQRHVTIGYERPADRGHRDPWFLVTQSVDWSRDKGASNVLPLPISSSPPSATQLTLVIDEGDNSALPVSSVQLLLPSYRLRFVGPASSARLVYGSASMDVPRYDLALLAPSVLQAEVGEVSMAAEAPTADAAQEQLISPRMFWVVLAAAVIALLGVLVVLLRASA
jgi:hypothetical protein